MAHELSLVIYASTFRSATFEAGREESCLILPRYEHPQMAGNNVMPDILEARCRNALNENERNTREHE